MQVRNLNPMQAAYWVGRNKGNDVSSHLYMEFEGRGLDTQRLQEAILRLMNRHSILRMRVDDADRMMVDETLGNPVVEVDSFASCEGKELRDALDEKRRRWTHRHVNLCRENPVSFSLSILPEGRVRLHVDVDMLAVDPSCARLMMIELSSIYLGGKSFLAEDGRARVPLFFQWSDQMSDDPFMKKKRARDRDWWQQRLADMPDPITLPADAKSGVRSDAEGVSVSMTAQLDGHVTARLRRSAAQMGVSMPAMLLTAFSLVISHRCRVREFLIPTPAFWQEGLTPGTVRMLGEFANILHVSMGVRSKDSFSMASQRTYECIMSLLEHRHYPGVHVARDLSRMRGAASSSPIVFTSGLGMEEGEDLFPEDVVSTLGEMIYSVSQGPGVALDAQVMSVDGCLSLNWDVRLDMVSEAWARSMLGAYVSLLKVLGSEGASCEISVADLMEKMAVKCDQASWPSRSSYGKVDVHIDPARHETPLSTLQKAYLLGRDKDMPLGGVAMQDFREYRGKLSPGVFKETLRQVVGRHEAMRTYIDVSRLMQWVSEEVVLNLDILDLSALSADEAERVVETRRRDFGHSIIDLDTSPWAVEVLLLPGERTGTGEHADAVVFIKFDALIADGYAISGMIKEMLQGTGQEEQGEDSTRDQKEALGGPALPDREHAREYWAVKVTELQIPMVLPWLVNPEDIRSSQYRRETRVVGSEEIRKLQRVGGKQGLFLNSMLMALCMQVLSFWSEQGGVVVGVPIAPVHSRYGQGNGSSFIAVQWRRDGRGFVERARSLQNDVHKGVENGAFSGVDLNRLLLKGGANTKVLLPVVMTNGLSWPVLDDDCPLVQVGGCTHTPQTALDIRFMRGRSGELVIDIDYAISALDQGMVTDIADSFMRAITESALNGLADMAWQKVLGIPEGAKYEEEAARSENEAFLGRISRNLFHDKSGRVALICGNERIDYESLGRQVLGAAEWMTDHGIGRGSIVALCLPKSVSSVVITVSCSLLGAVWVPIDRSAPEARLRYLIERCNPSIVIGEELPDAIDHVTAEDVISCIEAGGIERVASRLPNPFELSLSTETSYCLYTSGTTGTPKCVALNNRATENVVINTLSKWEVTPDDRLISVTPFHHDMSVFDIFGALAAGATLVLPDIGREKDAKHWYDLLLKHEVTLWVSVPTILEMLLIAAGEGGLGAMRLFAQGGDYIKQGTIKRLRNKKASMKLVSLGGPTETTIWSIWHDITSADESQVPYGVALPGNANCILDDEGLICPVGVPGRIYTTGVNLANGYWVNGQLDQTDFLDIHDARGSVVRAFRTGDVGCYRRDGEILFRERVSGYVKIRGVRVSLPDIENALVGCKGLDQIMVIDVSSDEDQDPVLVVLYVSSEGAQISSRDIRLFAKRVLSDSHVPSHYVSVKNIPVLSNGKPDRAQGRVIARELFMSRGANNKNDRSVLEKMLSDVYGKLLRLDRDIAPDEILVDSGLLPRHLKRVSECIHESSGLRFSPAELLGCRCINDVLDIAAGK